MMYLGKYTVRPMDGMGISYYCLQSFWESQDCQLFQPLGSTSPPFPKKSRRRGDQHRGAAKFTADPIEVGWKLSGWSGVWLG